MNYERNLEKAMAELAVAKALGPNYAEAALKQAKHHISQALDDARRQHTEETCKTPTRP